MKTLCSIVIVFIISTNSYSQEIIHPIKSTPIVGTGAKVILKENRIVSWYENSYSIWDINTGETIYQLHLPTCISTLDINNNGNQILTTCAELLQDDKPDSLLRIFDLYSGNLLKTLIGHRKGTVVMCAYYTHDNTRIISQGSDGTTRIWDTETGNLLVTIPDVNYINNSPSTNKKGDRIVTTSNSAVRIWNTNSGELISTLFGVNETTNMPRFNNNGDRILCTDAKGNIGMYDVETGTLIREFKGHTLQSYSAQFSNDNKRVVTSSIDSTAIIFDAETGETIHTLKTAPIKIAEFNEDGTYLFTTNEHTFTIWNALTGKKVKDLRYFPFRLHTFYFYNNSTLILSGFDGTIELYDAPTGNLQRSIIGMSVPRRSEFGVDNKFIVTLDNNCAIKIWDAQTFKLLRVIMNDDYADQFIYNRNSNIVVTTQGIYSVTIWDVMTGSLIAKLKMGNHFPNSIEFDSSGSFFTTSGADSKAIMWNAKTGKLVNQFNGHTGNVLSASFNNSGSRLLTTGSDGTAKLWDTQTGKEISTFNKIYRAQFSLASNTIIVVHWDKIPRLWSSENGELLNEYSTPIKGYDGFHINSDASKYVYFPKYNVCGVVNLLTGEDICSVTLPNDELFYSAFYDNLNQRIITYSASSDSVFIWNVNNGNIIAILQGHVRPVTSLTIDATGNNILTCSVDGTVKKWSLEEKYVDNSKPTFSLSPNPTDNQLRLIVNKPLHTKAGYVVFDILGKKMYEGIILENQNEVSIDTKFLPIGVYYCILEMGDETYINKFVISR